MSKENLERFMTQVADSEDLQAKIGEEITGDALVALGAAHGCEFSIEDVQAGAELSDTELDAVAGGIDIGPVFRGLGSDNDSDRLTGTRRLGLRRASSGLAMRGGRFRVIVEPQF